MSRWPGGCKGHTSQEEPWLYILIIIHINLYIYIHWLIDWLMCTLPLIGSPNCPTVNTTSLAVSIHKPLSIRWLPEWFSVEVSSHSIGPNAIVYNSTLKDTASLEVTSLQPDTVYDISVTPCNMAGCNESYDVLSIQTEFGGEIHDCVHLRWPHCSLTQCRTSLSFCATWQDVTQYKQHKQAMKVRWSECKVQLKQKDNNCSCLCIIHSEPEDASRSYFGITFTVIAVMFLTIVIVTGAMAVAITII